MHITKTIISSILTVPLVAQAHMAMRDPCPRYNAHGIDCPKLPPGQKWDYSETSPLGPTEPLCKFTVPFPTPSAKWTAGQSVTVNLGGHATHGGGHCQYSLSYDGGKTFVVVHEVLEHCFGPNNAQRNFTFALPKNIPNSQHAVFAWTWVNAIGNREFYMNCADVSISGSASSKYTGKSMVIANHQGYPTIPEFHGNYKTGLDLYKNAPSVTVTGSGSSSGSSPGSGSNGTTTTSGYDSRVPHGDYSSGGAGSKSASLTGYSAPPVPSESTPGPAATSNTATPVPTGAYSTTMPPVYSSALPVPTTESDDDTDCAPDDEPEPATTSSQQNSGPCESGKMQCSGTGYVVCVDGGWTGVYPCGSGTACQEASGSVFCGWPKK